MDNVQKHNILLMYHCHKLLDLGYIILCVCATFEKKGPVYVRLHNAKAYEYCKYVENRI
jgi:hypothetical protein